MINKDKIYELKIDEDDDVSGIDSISLVDEPAIEVNWVAFNKEKQHDFHIPDGEDDSYLEQLMKFAIDEQELFDEGFEIDRIEYIRKQNFVESNPNEPSELDDNNFRVRFKYVLNPNASGPAVIPTTRQFCKELISRNYVFRIEDMLNSTNDMGQSFADWRGGYNCRHVFAKIIYRRKQEIKDDAKGKHKKGYDILGDTQNDTRTKNPSFAKEEFGGSVSFDYDGTLDTPEGRLDAKRYIQNGYDVYIVTKRSIGERGPVDRLAKQLGIPEKNVIFTNGKDKSDYLRKYHIQKHIDNNPDVISEINKNAPEIRTEQFDYDVSGIGGYVDPGITKKKHDNSKQHFATDVDKQIVLGPAMIPNEKIFRKDDQGNPYFVFFTPETIKMIAQKYMKYKLLDNNDMMHDGEAVPDVFVMESWIKESKNDKSTDYGFEKLPVGTWFVSMKINNSDIWDKIKKKELNGFSVSGFFEEVAAFKREDAFLLQVAEILKKIDDNI